LEFFLLATFALFFFAAETAHRVHCYLVENRPIRGFPFN
jgi:hypothetical protein